MDISRATSIWKILVNPLDIEMEDISNVLIDTALGVLNMRYIKPQDIALRHGDEE